MGVLFATIGAAFLAFGGVIAIPRIRRACLWSPVQAEIVGFEKKRRQRPIGRGLIAFSWVYHPQLRFTDMAGNERFVVLDLGKASSPCWDPTGGFRPIRFNPADPNQVVEWEPWVVWLPPVALLLVGTAALVIAYWVW